MAPNPVEKVADTLPALKHKGEETKKPKFDKEKVIVIFVLGGPGAGASCFPLPLIVKIRSWIRQRDTVQPSCREV